MYTDRIDLTLPAADLASILSFLLSSEELLAPLQSVSPSDRKHLAKLGLKNEVLARQIIEVGRANPGLIPRDIDFEPIDRDLLAREQLRSLKVLLERLLGRVNDSLLLTGVDIYAAALSIYHCLKRNGQTASLRAVVEELKQGFARPSRKKKGEESERSAGEQGAEAVPAGPSGTALRQQVLSATPVAAEDKPERGTDAPASDYTLATFFSLPTGAQGRSVPLAISMPVNSQSVGRCLSANDAAAREYVPHFSSISAPERVSTSVFLSLIGFSPAQGSDA